MSDFPDIGVEPYFVGPKGRVVIYHGDSLDLLQRFPASSVAHVIADPPYSEHVHSNHRTNDGSAGGAGKDLGFDAIDSKTMRLVAEHIGRICRRWSLIFSDIESVHLWKMVMTQHHEYIRTGLWVKPNPMPQITGDRPGSGAEAIVITHPAGAKRWNSGGRSNIWTHHVPSSRRGRVHHTEKPIPLLEDLIASFTDVGDIILDPFAGSGTTARAAANVGRRTILIEAEERWCEQSASRFGAPVPETGEQKAMLW